MMEVDCSERLMRCYSNTGSDWEQTFGRHCQQALGNGCYLRGCIDVCESH